jgi:alpha-galactosidase
LAGRGIGLGRSRGRWSIAVLLFFVCIALSGCSSGPSIPDALIWVENEGVALGMDHAAQFTIYRREEKGWVPATRQVAEAPSLAVELGGHGAIQFGLDSDAVITERVETDLGPGRRWTIPSSSSSASLSRVIEITAYSRFPQALVLRVGYENLGDAPLAIDQVTLGRMAYVPPSMPLTGKPELWAFGGASWRWGQKIVFPLEPDLAHDNYLGQVDSGEGGGIPLVYAWDGASGLALSHIETEHQDWHMPLSANGRGLPTFALERRDPFVLEPGQAVWTPHASISVHEGDYYDPLATYASMMRAQGWAPGEPSSSAYDPVWCGWGYEFDFTIDDMLGVIPMLQRLGIPWAALDDRWFDAYGDWMPREDIFPQGEVSMRRMVDSYHAAGIRVQLWWYPLAAEDDRGAWASHAYRLSDVVAEHPDWLILDESGHPARNNRNLAVLCPAVPDVQAYIVDLTQRFIGEWGFDGHKLDNVYIVPPCHNPAHHHADPSESVQALPEVYRLIHETTKRLKPDSVTMLSPCGSTPNVYLMPHVDQPMMSDPFGSWQVRMRIKVLKALIGPDAAVFADHVELTDDWMDFASMIAPGGVPGTKFVWPDDPGVEERLYEAYYLLGEDKADHWERWLSLYRELDLARGEYLNLYDTIYEVPEGHVVRKEDDLYYSFFADVVGQFYEGRIVLKGLRKGRDYRLINVETGDEVGVVRGPEVGLRVNFQSHLLLKATPK